MWGRASGTSRDAEAAKLESLRTNENWRFAQELLGNHVPAPPSPQAMAERAEYFAFLADVAPLLEIFWDPAKHPRGAFPENRGWFSPKTGSAAGSGSASPPAKRGISPDEFRRRLVDAANRSADERAGEVASGGGAQRSERDAPQSSRDASGAIFRTVYRPGEQPVEIKTGPYRSDDPRPQVQLAAAERVKQASTPKKPAPAASAGNPPPTPPPTRSQLPADDRGTWISGTKGNGRFRFHDTPENRAKGLAGKIFGFKNENIAVGGFPPEMYDGGDRDGATVEIPEVTGRDADNKAADKAMRKKLGDPNWKRPKGYRWNHAGEPGSKVMELVKEEYHSALAHKGPAATARQARRQRRTGGGGSAGRALAVFNVYLTTRDVLQSSGVLAPKYETLDEVHYEFKARDGSTFVVREGGPLSSPRREYVDGPRKGQSEEISQEELEEYRRQGEEEWGKYIPGSIFSGPRFIPGKKLKQLPVYRDIHRLPHEIGYIDETGFHEHPQPRMVIG